MEGVHAMAGIEVEGDGTKVEAEGLPLVGCLCGGGCIGCIGISISFLSFGS